MSWRAGILLLVAALLPPALMAWAWCSWTDTRLAWLGWLLYRGAMVVGAVTVATAVWRWRRRECSLGGWWRLHWPGALLAVVAAVMAFVLVPPEMRVQFDETSIVGTSQNMHLQDSALMTTGAIPFDGVPVMLENTVDKRPTLFALLVSLLHDFTGYRVANAFVVNGLVFAAGLLLLFACVRARAGLLAAWTAQLAVLSVPLVVVTATSAGFEPLATVMLLATAMAALAFVARPDDTRCALFVGCALSLAWCRYESALAVVVLAVMVWFAIRRSYRPGKVVCVLLACCPSLLAPLGLLFVHAQSPNFTPEAGGQAKLAFAHFADHLLPFLGKWFDPGLANAMPGALAVVAVLAYGWRMVRGRATRVDAFHGLPVLALTVVALFWFYGDLREQTAWRLFLPLAWLTAVLPLAWLTAASPRVARIALVVAAVWLPLRWIALVDGSAFPRTRFAAMTAELDRVVARLPGEVGDTLWVGSPAQHLIVKGHAALSVRAFRQRGRDVTSLLRQRQLRHVYLLVTPIDDDMAPAFGSARELLQRYPATVVERVGGQMPITVYRLSP